MNSQRGPLPLHPFLIAVFPIVFLYAENVREIWLDHLWLPALVILAFAVLLLLLNSILFRNIRKAALFTSAFLLLFFLYRPVFTQLENHVLLGIIRISRHRELIPVFLLPLAGLGIYLWRTEKHFNKLNSVFNVVAALLLLPSLAKITWHAIQVFGIVAQPGINVSAQKPLPAGAPDIYNIIADAYAREDVLKEVFSHNNAAFLKALEARGFYVAHKSTSNYNQTRLSVPSLLNYNYITELPGYKNSRRKKDTPLHEMIGKSAIRWDLKEYGYQFISFATGFGTTEIEDADQYIKPKLLLTEFQTVLLNVTPIPDLLTRFLPRDLYDMHRKRILSPFERLDKVIEIPSPKFVQIHLMSPHPPFVFDTAGNPVQADYTFMLDDGNWFLRTDSEEAYKKGYREQLIFLNKKLLAAIDTIQKKSKVPAVIILQGDHGARLHLNWDEQEKSQHLETFANLNALYLPGKDTSGLYQEMSLVNNFRIVLNKYFQANLPLLPDRNFNATGDLEFMEVTDKVQGKTRLNPSNKTSKR